VAIASECQGRTDGRLVAGVTAVRALYNRFERFVHELGKFGTVGAIALVVNSGVFNAFLIVAPDKQIFARATATTVATCVTYVGNRYWTYRDRDIIDRRREMFFFFLVNGIAMVIEVMFVFISKYGLGQDGPLAMNIASYAFGLPLGMVFRLYCYRTFVFPEGVEPEAAEGAVPAGSVPAAAGTATPGASGHPDPKVPSYQQTAAEGTSR
jgi:putative flippase GtrA